MVRYITWLTWPYTATDTIFISAYAAAFFLLGDSLKDCVGVCLRQLDDFHLALTIARVYEGDDGPFVRDILNRHVLPLAFTRGHRRLAIWAFWMLKRRDLAVQAIVVSGVPGSLRCLQERNNLIEA